MAWIVVILIIVAIAAGNVSNEARKDAGIERGGCRDILLWIAAVVVVFVLVAVASMAAEG